MLPNEQNEINDYYIWTYELVWFYLLRHMEHDKVDWLIINN